MGVRGTGAWIGRAGAGRRLAWRRAQRYLGLFCSPKVSFFNIKSKEIEAFSLLTGPG
jgi:hypothetical protein